MPIIINSWFYKVKAAKSEDEVWGQFVDIENDYMIGNDCYIDKFSMNYYGIWYMIKKCLNYIEIVSRIYLLL